MCWVGCQLNLIVAVNLHLASSSSFLSITSMHYNYLVATPIERPNLGISNLCVKSLVLDTQDFLYRLLNFLIIFTLHYKLYSDTKLQNITSNALLKLRLVPTNCKKVIKNTLLNCHFEKIVGWSNKYINSLQQTL